MIPLLGFTPDVDPATPGVIVEATNAIPHPAGMKGAHTAVAVSDVPALAAECRNAAVAALLAGTRRVFAGTSTKLYELSGGVWLDRSRGGSYSLGTDERWSIAQFGDDTLASNKSTVVQRSPGAGAFADVATAPKAVALACAAGFVMAVNTNEATYGDSPDRWWCCAQNNAASWTPSVTTLATTGRLVSSPGPLITVKAFGDQVVAYKEKALYLGRFVAGDAAVWQFDQVPGDVGCVGVDAVTDIGPAHIFVGRGDIFYFDGTRPVSIAEGTIRQWFYDNASPEYLSRTIVTHDKQQNLVWFFYASKNSTGARDSAIVYLLGRREWGVVTQTIEASMNYVSPGFTYDTLPGATMDTMPAISFDSQYWLASGRFMAVFTSAHQLSSLTGVTGASSITLFDVGDDIQVTRLDRMTVSYLSNPTSATCAGFTRLARGAVTTTGGTGTYTNGKFDIRQAGRFHKVRVDMVGNWTAAGVNFILKKAGNR